jgi:hypothetical protein
LVSPVIWRTPLAINALRAQRGEAARPAKRSRHMRSI